MPRRPTLATRRRRAGAAARVAMATAIGALFFYILSRFGPSRPSLALISLAAPLLALLALLGGFALLALRRRGSGSILCLLALIALGDSLHDTLWSPWPVPTAGARTTRIVQFNAWTANRDPQGASRWILAQQADAVVLLEAAGAGAVVADQLATTFPHRVTCRGLRPCSTLILSRTAPIETRPLARGDADNRQALSAVVVRFPAYTLVAVHLSRPSSAARQLAETAQLAAALRAAPAARLVVTGDFNSPLWTLPMRRLRDGLGLRAIAPDTPSWPVPQPDSLLPALLPIDHALLGPDWSAATLSRGPAIGSDHYPALIELVP